MYLGLPLRGNPKSISFWHPVLNSLSRRLDGWKKVFLSLGSRITIIQSCLLRIPSYFLSLFKIPTSIALRIEKLQRDFLWSGFGEGKRDHLVSWDIVCRSNEFGGLGFRKITLRNQVIREMAWQVPLGKFCPLSSSYLEYPWDTS